MIHSFENPLLWLQAISWGPSGRLLFPLAAAGALLAVGMLWRVSALRSWFRAHTGGTRSAADRSVGHEVGGSDGGGSDGEERFHDFFANAAVPLHIFGPDRIIIDINQAELDLIGYERSEIVGVKTWADLIVPEQCEQFERHWRRLLQTHDVRNLEYTVVRKDGRHVYVLLNASARYDVQGRLLNTRGSVVDITRRVEAEAALRRSEGLYRTLVENIDLGIMLISSEYEVLMTNATEGKVLSKPVSDLIQREIEKCSKEGVPCAGTRAMATGRPAEDETEGVGDDGVRFTVHIQAFPVTGSEGTITGFIEVVEDVTDRRDAQRALAESEERYRTLVENIPGVLYRCEIEPPWAVDHISEGMENLVGRVAADFMAGKVTIGEMIHPDDLPDVVEGVRQAVEARRAFTLEYRFRHVDGSDCWVHENGRAIYDERGEPLWLDGVILDVSDRHRYEEAQRKSEERYRVFFLTSHDAFMTVSPAGKLLSFNPAMKEMFRAADDAEMRSLAPWQMSPPRQPDGRLSSEKAAEMIQAALRDGSNFFEWTHRRFDGEDFPATVMISCGELRGERILHATIRDVTAQKKAEKAILASEARYRSIFDSVSDGIMVFDIDTLAVLDANQGFADMLGYTRDELTHLDVAALSAGGADYGRQAILDDLNVVRKEGKRLREWRGKRKTGEFLWLEIAVNIVTVAGEERALAVVHDITERKAADEAIRASEARYRSIFDLSSDGIAVFDMDTLMILDGNQGLADMFGYPRDELMHLTLLDLSAGGPDFGRQAIQGVLVQVRKEGSMRHQWRGKRKTGELRWLEVTTTAMNVAGEDRGLAVGHDITEKKEADEAIRASEARYRSIFDLSRDGIVVFDVDTLMILDANQGFADMFGYTRDELTHMTLLDVSAGEPDFGRQAMRGNMVQVREEGPLHRQWRGKRKTGELRWMEITITAMTVAGEDRGLAVGHDITEKKEADTERRKVAEQMQHAQKLESLGVLAGGIAHDFNNLLVAILGNADLALMDMAANAAERSSIEEIKRAAKRASDLTNQMLAYSGKGQFIIEPVNLNDLVGEMGRLLEVSISKKAILRYDLAEGLPTVEVDASQIRQVVMNLITNASDAIGSASGSISLRTSEVDADRSFLADTYLGESLPEGPYVCLEVSDTGCGMDDETLKRLFEPFYSTKFSGRGLGLAAVLGIVRGHRGGLRVRSELDVGSTFEILIPAVLGVAAVAPVAAPAALPWQAQGVVLVVDDEPSVRKVAKIMLTRSGLTVLTAKDGVEAMEVFRREGDRIDLVLLDMTMPRMGGDEAYQAMRKMRPDVKVVLTSGYGEKAITDRFALEGLAGFIQKPFELEKLMTMIRDILG